MISLKRQRGFLGAAAIGIGGSLLSGAISANASKSAANTQADAANRATDTQLQMFNTQNQQQAPFRQSGYTALNALNYGLYGSNGAAPSTAKPSFVWEGTDYGTPDAFKQANLDNYRKTTGQEPNAAVIAQLDNNIAQTQASGGQVQAAPTNSGATDPGYFSHQFGAADLNANLAPNYQFQLEQGQGAAKNALNLIGGMGGNFGKGLVDYTVNKAGDAYQQAFNNYSTNQSNIFNRLSTVAGFGSGANQQSTSLAGALAPGISGSIQGAGAAQAAGTVGAANALTGGANNALGWYTLGNLTTPAGGGTPYSTLAATPFNDSSNYG